MRVGKTLQEMAAELERQKTTKKDYLSPTQKLAMENSITDTNGKILAGSEPMLSIDGIGAFKIAKLGFLFKFDKCLDQNFQPVFPGHSG